MNRPSFPAPRSAMTAVVLAALIGAGLTAIAPAAQPAAADDPTPQTYVVSHAAQGTSDAPALSADGQHVAFVSTEALMPGDTNTFTDVYVSTANPETTDPFSGQAVLLSRPGSSAGISNGDSSEPAISADGRYVVFTSTATNLITGTTTSGRRQVYLRDTVLDTTTMISAGGVEPDGDSYSADITADGRRIVFVSTAGNLAAGDADGQSDIFVADRDADGDGSYTSLSIQEATLNDAAQQFQHPKISGNGSAIIYRDIRPPDPLRPGDNLYIQRTNALGNGSSANNFPGQTSRFVKDADIDYSGLIVAEVGSNICGNDTVIVIQLAAQSLAVAVGTPYIDQTVGGITSVAISADASTVAWSGTQPAITSNGSIPPALDQPEVRVGHPSYTDAWENGFAVQCYGPRSDVSTLVGLGDHPSLSAGGRSIAYSGPGAGSETSVYDVDTHSSNGLSVSTTQGTTLSPMYMTSYPTSAISAAAIHDYGAAFADAPIHKVPIHKVPIHKVPIHKVPIHKVPIHKVPIHKVPIHKVEIPGGWTQLLVGTPFDGQSDLVVTLGEVLAWAEATAPNLSVDQALRDAAQRILDLTLDDMDIDGSGIDALSLGALVLGSAPLSQVAVPGAGNDLTARWQTIVYSQGLKFTVAADTVLAELDFAGVDVGRTGVDAVPLNSLPIAETVLDVFPIVATDTDMGLELTGTIIGGLRVSALPDPSLLFTEPVTGTIAENLSLMKPGATAADLAAAMPPSVTFGDFLATLLDSASYPWEQISPSALDPAKASSISVTECQTWGHCDRETWYTFAFDPGPGEDTAFPQAVATITGPPGTRTSTAAVGAGPIQAARGVPIVPTTNVGETTTYALGDVAAGSTITIDASYQVTAMPIDGETSGAIASRELIASADQAYLWDLQNYRNATDPGLLKQGTVYYGWLPPTYKNVDEGQQVTGVGPSAQVDTWSVAAPRTGQRLVVSTNATDGQISISLYKPASATTDLGVADLGAAPGTGTTEQSATTSGAPAQSGTDAGTPVVGSVLLDQSTVSGGGSADIRAASTDASPGQTLSIHVTSGNGQPSSSLYSLRVQYIDEPVGPVCARWTPAQTADPGVVGTSDLVTATTNTIYVMDTKRFGDTWGSAGAASVRAALKNLEGTGVVPVHGAVISVDADLAVQTARATLDADPCDMAARSALVKAINASLASQIGTQRSRITSVVMVGGDDILPLAPVAEHTEQFTEQSHASDLRRATQPDGTACVPVADGIIDPCATPIQAAAATNHILSDDPYALAAAYDTVGGALYVPSVGIGRLVETPAQILAALGQFTTRLGVMAANSTLTGGYGPWGDLPDTVVKNLGLRVTTNTQLQPGWTKEDVAASLFPATGESARVVSVNAHFDETALLPGIPGAENGLFTDGQLYKASAAASASNPQAIAGALLFTIGCHAANNLPSSYYGDVTDWVDVFQGAGGFVGNTGYGLASDTASALSERLLALYASWIGVTAGGAPVTSAGALVQAKHAYLAQLGLYSGYDQKALMESVYYGLPMYTFAHSDKSVPLPEIPDLGPVETKGALTAASLKLTSSFEPQGGSNGTYFTVDGEAPVVIAGEPVLPKVTKQLPPAKEGLKARGVLIRAMTSDETTAVPLLAKTTAGVDSVSDATRSNIAFPSSFGHVTTQQTPSGPVDLLVVTPAHVEAPTGGKGTIETFTSMDLDVVYGSATPADDTDPVITSTEIRSRYSGGASLYATADGTGSAIVAMELLVQPQGSADWHPVSMDPTHDERGSWVGDIQEAEPYRWILQAVDAAGNVGIYTARGHIDVGGAQAPALGSMGGDATVAPGERLTRSVEVTDATLGEPLTGSFAITADGHAIATGIAVVAAGADDTTRASIDTVVTTPGTYRAALTVCRGGKCTTGSFVLDVPVPDHAPTATATFVSLPDPVTPDSVLTVAGTGADVDVDADGARDVVTLTYAWLRNGVPIAGQSSASLNLHGLVGEGDTITAEVVPVARGLAGGAARVSTVVTAPIVVPPPTITAVTTAGGLPYKAGDWSRVPVTVTFKCTSTLVILECTPSQTVSADTAGAGLVVTGKVRDFAHVVTLDVLVKVDKTAPLLAPTVTPNPVVQGQVATAAPNASDAASGIASKSCGPVSTATSGNRTVSCKATDAAGNTASASVGYLVTPAKCTGVADRTALAPVNLDSSSVFSRISAIPIIFRACDAAGKAIGAAGFVVSVTQVSSTALPATAKVNESIYLLPTIKPVFIKRDGTWAGSIGLATLTAGKKYTYRVSLADGSWFTFTFGVR